MKTICSWCRKEISRNDEITDVKTSHGICPECYAEMMAKNHGGLRNARFWIFWNGTFTKLTLRPGQRVAFWRSWEHEEGWSGRGEVFRYDVRTVTIESESETDGRDCDGRLQQMSFHSCAVRKLRDADPRDETKVERPEISGLPRWRKAKQGWQFDEFAAAAGY